jgi:AraC-like DNA-binding protein
MSTPELVFRVAILTQLGLLSLMLFRQGAVNRSFHYAAILLLGIASYVLAPLVAQHWHWGVAAYPIILLAILVPALFWFFAAAVFEDGFVPPHWVKWLVVATALLGFWSYCTSTNSPSTCRVDVTPIPDWIAQAAKLLWITSALVIALKDWRGDLVEARRRLRLLIVVAGGCYMGAIVTIELFLQTQITANAELANVSVLLVAVTALCIHFLAVNSTNVFARMAKAAPPASVQTSPLAEQVVALMEHERAFALDPLSIQTLADRLRTQPHRLRRVINDELGYRNFNAFINLYRIKEVAHRLGQAEYSHTPLLTLALDAGFRSLAPFNRSFKAHYGVTPSDYRHNLETPVNP